MKPPKTRQNCIKVNVSSHNVFTKSIAIFGEKKMKEKLSGFFVLFLISKKVEIKIHVCICTHDIERK